VWRSYWSRSYGSRRSLGNRGRWKIIVLRVRQDIRRTKDGPFGVLKRGRIRERMRRKNCKGNKITLSNIIDPLYLINENPSFCLLRGR